MCEVISVLEKLIIKLNEWILNNLTVSIVTVTAVTVVVVFFAIQNIFLTTAKNESIVTIEESVKKDVVNSDDYIYTEIAGAVLSPGVYDMKPGTRVVDLVERAGGFSQDADFLTITQKMNLSMKLSDEQKIYIPFSWDIQVNNLLDSSPSLNNNHSVRSSQVSDKEGAVVSPDDISTDTDTKVQINTASPETLKSLKGIGAAYAQRIIDNRPYVNQQDMIQKSGLSESLIQSIEAYIVYD